MPFGRTRRSAPTQTISTRNVQPSDAVTPVFVGTHGLDIDRASLFFVKARRLTICRGGPMCPPVLVGALYAIWADTQVRPYTNHINTKSSAIRRCNTSIRRDARPCVPTNRYTSRRSDTSLHILLYYNGRTTVRPYNGLHVTAFRHITTRHGVQTHRYTSRRPYKSLHV